MRTTVEVKGMHCPACVKRLTDAFQRVPGVRSAQVTLNPPAADIESDGPVPVQDLDRAAKSAGNYSVNGSTAAATSARPDAHDHHAHGQAAGSPAVDAPAEPRPSLYPLGLIVLYIAGTAALATYFRGTRDPHTFMLDFMAGFFLVFSFFKLLDLRGFADAYQSYDIVARRSRPWALVYPFVELALGVAYLVRWQLTLVNAVTLVLMLLGSIGVLRAVLQKNRIRCACLGTALNLPMTTVTLVEDLGMAAMAGLMLFWGR
ncbi:MAG: MauE/DoxX family redox-associated membrane protein [Phycisphaerales bacterium]